MKIIIKVLIVFNLFTSLFAQKEEGEISILSEKVGKLIDLEERNKFKLFPAEGFQSAVLYKLPDGKYYFKITRIDGSTGDEIQYRIEQSESEIGKIRKYLENFSDYTGLSDEQSEIRRNQIEWGQNDTTFIQTRHPGLITTVKGQLIPFARVDVNQGILSYLPAGSKKNKVD